MSLIICAVSHTEAFVVSDRQATDITTQMVQENNATKITVLNQHICVATCGNGGIAEYIHMSLDAIKRQIRRQVTRVSLATVQDWVGTIIQQIVANPDYDEEKWNTIVIVVGLHHHIPNDPLYKIAATTVSDYPRWSINEPNLGEYFINVFPPPDVTREACFEQIADYMADKKIDHKNTLRSVFHTMRFVSDRSIFVNNHCHIWQSGSNALSEVDV